MVHDLEKARDSTLQSGGRKLALALQAGDTHGLLTQVRDVGDRCLYLGLLDAQGNPT